MKNLAEKERVEAAGGAFANERLFGMLQPTRSFGDADVQRSVVLFAVVVRVRSIEEER